MKLPSYQDLLPQNMLYNRLIFYSYYLNIVWIWVIRKGEENTCKSSVEIWWVAGIHFPKTGVCSGSFRGLFSHGKLHEPSSPRWNRTGSSVTAVFQGPDPKLSYGASHGKENKIIADMCRGKGTALHYVPALSHQLHPSPSLSTRVFSEPPAAIHIHYEPRIVSLEVLCISQILVLERHTNCFLLYHIHNGVLLFPPAHPSSWLFSTSSTPACYLHKPPLCCK